MGTEVTMHHSKGPGESYEEGGKRGVRQEILGGYKVS